VEILNLLRWERQHYMAGFADRINIQYNITAPEEKRPPRDRKLNRQASGKASFPIVEALRSASRDIQYREATI
jgi:hypothetical protein